VAPAGFGIAITIALIARPLVVFVCLLPFQFTRAEIVYIGLVGLRGAVPIVLATIPVMAGADPSRDMFNLVFFVAVVGAIIPGATVARITRFLGLESSAPPRPTTNIEIESGSSGVELRSYYVEASLAVAGATLRDIPFPQDAAVTVVERARELIPPNGDLRLQAGDHVFVLARREDRSFIELLFGVAEE
jgi:cell volume regulation protein A